ncbi:hypothetical protein QFZ65_000937 [Arthrobacter sp. B3I9]|uniref:type II secretion system F family protein n=1 Tax=Arthrobacter sp. B3I9 TaxID=3042270 RepID=UPI0027926B4B|nr:type II secretion system F family protein [Arthrobacter sp. B3I9]MDQ0848999.1 hypothetical protein [Arthrobacter sp. B3I9]
MTAGLAGFAVGTLLVAATVVGFGGHSQPGRRLRRSHDERRWEYGGGSAGTALVTEETSGAAGLDDTAIMLELIGAMLDAGCGLGRALELITDLSSAELRGPLRPVVSALALGAGWDVAWRSSTVRSPRLVALQHALAFAALTGAPSSAVLYAQAGRIRRERFRTAEKQAAALGVKLVVPLGLCSLPAFVCLGIMPVLLAMVPA